MSMHTAFTGDSIEVWCPVVMAEGLTNFDGATHFCQYCGATDHSALPPAAHVAETSSSVQ